jgi:hypothetical protein
MHRGLHVLVFLAVLLAFGVSFALLSRVIGITSPWLVLLLMFYFLGLVKICEPLFRLRMPRVLRPLRAWELEGLVYRRYRVPEFGRVLRKTPLRYLNRAVYIGATRTDPFKVRIWAESSEAAHFWAAVLLMPYIVFALLNGMWEVVVWLSLAQLLVNVYPLLHLRYTRGRLDQVQLRGQVAHAGVPLAKSGA